MKSIRLFGLFALAGLALCGAAQLANEATTVRAEDARTMATYDYVPTIDDMKNPFGGSYSISDTERKGAGTFATDMLKTPLKGTDVQMDLGVKAYSATGSGGATGDGIDAWLTLSLSSTVPSADNYIPSFVGGVDGLFLQVTNHSHITSAEDSYPNHYIFTLISEKAGKQTALCNVSEAADGGIDGIGLNSNEALESNPNPFSIRFLKEESGKWLLTITKSDATLAAQREINGSAIDESLFINDKGQTFFSTYMYDAASEDAAARKLHRGVLIHSVKGYKYDASEAVVTLSQESYPYHEGDLYEPTVKVNVGGVDLVKDTDYTMAYANNTVPGTASLTIDFIGDYHGESITKNFTITGEYDGAALGTFDYVPSFESDVKDFFGVGQGLEKGVSFSAHAMVNVPMNGRKVEFTGGLFALSNATDKVTDTNNDVDMWIAFGLSNAPASKNAEDLPYYMGVRKGYFIQAINASTAENPNRWTMNHVKAGGKGIGSCSNVIALGNASVVDGVGNNTGVLKPDTTTKFKFSMIRGEDKWIISMTSLDGATTYLSNEIALNLIDESILSNEKGQTYLSVAMYDNMPYDDDHIAHRRLEVYDMKAYSLDASAADITLEQNSYVYEEGKSYKPEVTIKVGEKTLTKGTDYVVIYSDNRAVGTASAKIYFMGEYVGNAMVVKTFEIKAPAPITSSSSFAPSSSSSSAPGSSSSSSNVSSSAGTSSSSSGGASGSGCNGGCGGSIVGSASGAALLLLGVVGIAIKRKKQ